MPDDMDWTLKLTASVISGQTDFTDVPLAGRVGYIIGRPIGLACLGISVLANKLPTTKRFLSGFMVGATAVLAESAINKFKNKVDEVKNNMDRKAADTLNSLFDPSDFKPGQST